ncbi:peptidylprolyl isomerase [Serpentinimonas barnesii]|uniref:peptidylprolyl isomerase n=1 Tax=Serpentinimonas barnesii TaxID=1458427 RepID=UPI0004951980|nr:peptidylprolyl isomerase [Serpentinimonas barnesii]
MNHSNLEPQSGCGGLGGCGCQCSTAAAPAPAPVARINGVALHRSGEALPQPALLERAYAELLRQQAVQLGLLPALVGELAPAPDAAQLQAIEAMLDAELHIPEPTRSECERFYEANRPRFVVGQAMHVRHILFAVTPGVDVHALAQRAEQALLELSRTEVAPQRFEALARELSNCPTGAQGGNLGWIGPEDCAPELANELFFQTDQLGGMGLHPRLVHTRFGFHIIEVLGKRKGRTLDFDEAQPRIAEQLRQRARATALRQYLQLLAGAAHIEGIEIEAAATPLVQ